MEQLQHRFINMVSPLYCYEARCKFQLTLSVVLLMYNLKVKSIPSYILDFSSACSFFKASMSVGLAGHPMPRPSVALGLGIIWK